MTAPVVVFEVFNILWIDKSKFMSFIGKLGPIP